jgi:DNA-binding transcriptional ArsR family regulator
MKFTVRNQPDDRLEAVNILERFVEQTAEGESGASSDLHKATETLVKNLNLSSREETELFGPMRTVYDEVLVGAAPDDPWLVFYFSQLSANFLSLGMLVHYIRLSFPEQDASCAEAVRQYLMRDITEDGGEIPSGQDAAVRAFLDADVSDGAKVRLIDFYLEPMAHIERCGTIIDEYAARFRQQRAQLLPLYERFAEELRHDENACLHKLTLDIDNFEVQPMIYRYDFISMHTLPDGGAAGQTFVGYGVLVDFISRRVDESVQGNEKLLRVLKALDDKTRLRILTALREGPMYGHEIAKLTELSAATISHHVNELFSKDLIRFEKQGNSARYTLRGDTIEWLIGELGRLV